MSVRNVFSTFKFFIDFWLSFLIPSVNPRRKKRISRRKYPYKSRRTYRPSRSSFFIVPSSANTGGNHQASPNPTLADFPTFYFADFDEFLFVNFCTSSKIHLLLLQHSLQALFRSCTDSPLIVFQRGHCNIFCMPLSVLVRR